MQCRWRGEFTVDGHGCEIGRVVLGCQLRYGSLDMGDICRCSTFGSEARCQRIQVLADDIGVSCFICSERGDPGVAV